MIKTIILAAGQGSRLRPLTNDIPKALVNFNGKTIIDYQIHCYKTNNIEDIYVVGGYKHEKLNFLGLKKEVNKDFINTNMVASLYTLKKLFDGSNDILISYGDIIFEKRVISKIISDHGSQVSIIYDLNWLKLWSYRMDDPISDVESFRIDNHNNVLELGKKEKNISKIQGQYIGIIYIKKDFAKNFFDIYDKYKNTFIEVDGSHISKIYMTSYLQMLIDKGKNVKGISINGGWLEIDTCQDLENYNKMIESGAISEIIDLKF